MNFFHIQLLKGTVNFLKENNPEIAVTEEFAKKAFGSEDDALGKEVEVKRTFPSNRGNCEWMVPPFQYSV